MSENEHRRPAGNRNGGELLHDADRSQSSLIPRETQVSPAVSPLAAPSDDQAWIELTEPITGVPGLARIWQVRASEVVAVGRDPDAIECALVAVRGLERPLVVEDGDAVLLLAELDCTPRPRCGLSRDLLEETAGTLCAGCNDMTDLWDGGDGGGG